MIMKIYKKIDLYERDILPDEGWFQCCMRCDTITSNKIKVKTLLTFFQITEFYVHICPPCKNIIKSPKKKRSFKRRCNRYIDKFFI